MMVFNNRLLLAMNRGSVGYFRFRTCADDRFQFVEGAQCTRSTIALDILGVSFPFCYHYKYVQGRALYFTKAKQLWKRKKTTQTRQ